MATPYHAFIRAGHIVLYPVVAVGGSPPAGGLGPRDPLGQGQILLADWGEALGPRARLAQGAGTTVRSGEFEAFSVVAPERDGAGAPHATLGLAIGLQFMIAAGDGLAMVALASRVYERSHAGWAVASVFLAVSVPVAVLAPVAGLLLDKLPAKPVMTAAGVTASGVAVALIPVTGVAGSLGLAVGFGCCAAVLQPGLGAIVPRLVGAERVTQANSYLQTATWVGMTAGPLLAGVLGAVGGTGLALGGDAVTYALGAAGIAMLRLAAPHATDALPHTDAAASEESLLDQMRAGLTFLRGERTARLLVIIVAIMVGFGYLSVVAEVELAQGVLRAGPGGYAVLVASWTAGMAAGSLAGGRLPARWLVVAVLAGTVVTGAGLALAGLAPRLWLVALAYAVGGLGDGVEVLATRSYLNHRAPEEIAGRVFALYSGVMLGAASAGMAAASVLLAPLGPRLLLVIAGGGGIVAGAGGWLALVRYSPRSPQSPRSARSAR